MSPLERAEYERARSQLRLIKDAIERADDGLTEGHWYTLELGYVQAQLLRANKKIVAIVEAINAVINGRLEGMPPGHDAKTADE